MTVLMYALALTLLMFDHDFKHENSRRVFETVRNDFLIISFLSFFRLKINVNRKVVSFTNKHLVFIALQMFIARLSTSRLMWLCASWQPVTSDPGFHNMTRSLNCEKRLLATSLTIY